MSQCKTGGSCYYRESSQMTQVCLTNSKEKSCRAAILLPLNRQRVDAIDRELVEVREELLKSFVEGPARQQTDTLVCIDCAIRNGLLVHSCKESKLDLLFLSQVI